MKMDLCTSASGKFGRRVEGEGGRGLKGGILEG